MSEQKLGPYTLVRKIGQGAFGIVWLAEKRTPIATTQFALKFARNEEVDLEAFRSEARIWAHASGHPNVLPIIEADVYDEKVVIVSEYAIDGSLASWLQGNGGRSPTLLLAVDMTLQILSGLEHLHRRKIIHRDIKPENILLQHGTPRLTDFGVARLLRTDSYSLAVKGTPAYMAPEAFNGKRNEQTDVWSVGVLLYQMLVGHLPFHETDFTALVGAIISKDPAPLPPYIPLTLRRVVERALQRTVSKRFKDASEMRNSLEAVKRELSNPNLLTITLADPKKAKIQVKQFIHEPSIRTVQRVPSDIDSKTKTQSLSSATFPVNRARVLAKYKLVAVLFASAIV